MKKAMRRVNKETPIQSEILTWLNYQPGIIAFRLSNHAVPVIQYFNGRGVLAGWRKDKWKMMGLADICVFGKGKVFFVEVKTPEGSLSDEQRNFKEVCEKHGVDYIVATRCEDLKDVIKPTSNKNWVVGNPTDPNCKFKQK